MKTDEAYRLLEPFVGKPGGPRRWKIDEVWIEAGHLNATDERITARVPCDLPDDRKPLDGSRRPPVAVLKQWTKFPLGGGAEPLLKISEYTKAERTLCPHCHDYFWDERDVRFRIGGQDFDVEQIEKLRTLSGVRFAIGQFDGLFCMMFEAGELQGVLMAMKGDS